MSVLDALFLGVVQGLTEFLPVSSSGHLVLFQHILNTGEHMLAFDIVIHWATLLAVLIYYRGDFAEMIARERELSSGVFPFFLVFRAFYAQNAVSKISFCARNGLCYAGYAAGRRRWSHLPPFS